MAERCPAVSQEAENSARTTPLFLQGQPQPLHLCLDSPSFLTFPALHLFLSSWMSPHCSHSVYRFPDMSASSIHQGVRPKGFIGQFSNDTTLRVPDSAPLPSFLPSVLLYSNIYPAPIYVLGPVRIKINNTQTKLPCSSHSKYISKAKPQH